MMLLFVILVALAAWHYVWDGIIAPSRRMEYRFRLFSLRDEARELLFRDAITESDFRRIEDSINTAIAVLSSLDFVNLWRFHRDVAADADLRAWIDAQLVEWSEAPHEVQDLYRRATDILLSGLVTNVGAWMLPLAIVHRPISMTTQWLASALSWCRRVLALDEKKAEHWFRLGTSEPAV